MVKANLAELAQKLNAGEEVTNPGADNPEKAKAIADYHTEQRKEGEDFAIKDFQKLHKTIVSYYGKRDLARKILSIKPFYYDESKNWWMWCHEKFYWKLIDETDILNIVDHLALYNTVNSKEKNEIIEALKQESRKNKPEKIKNTWIQFDKVIYDIKTGDKLIASPRWFVTNPIPYQLHKDNFENTPTMDRIFEEWVGKDHIRTLYEIISYCMLPDYPINRIFCFIGSGLNGKSKFLELIKKFTGVDNCCSTELDMLLTSRFEVTRLHKKLVCMMGETNFGEIKNTSILKKLTGGDLIGFEYKGKNPFHEVNYAKIIISTNNLPTTNDKTIGFYRRWMIIDFPNQFSEKKDIILDIPEDEYNCLALKCCTILKGLLEQRAFTNEGSIEERTQKFEDRSNFFDKFWKEYIEEDPEGEVSKSDFERRFSQFCKNNRHRMPSPKDINEKMKEKGIEESRFYASWYENDKEIKKQVRGWTGIKWK
jgi:P4 family phage/plasmid primase-like protien